MMAARSRAAAFLLVHASDAGPAVTKFRRPEQLAEHLACLAFLECLPSTLSVWLRGLDGRYHRGPMQAPELPCKGWVA